MLENNKIIENIEYSEEWLLKEIFKIHEEEQKSGQVQYLKIKKIKLLNLVLKFIKLNRKGE